MAELSRSGGAAETSGRSGKAASSISLAVLCGILIGTSYIPFPPWASLFCFLPLWICWSRAQRAGAIFFSGWLASFVFTLIGFNWVAYMLHEFAHLPWFLAIPGLLLYAATANLYVPLAGLIWYYLRKTLSLRDPVSGVVMVLVTALCEMNAFTLFDWNFGYSWYGSGLPLYQWAEFLGFSGLSTLTILFNLPLWIAWRRRGEPAGFRIAVAAAAVFVALNLCGILIETRLPAADDELRALLVQANIGNEEKSAAELGTGFRQEILLKQLDLTLQALSEGTAEPVDFVLWPEAAFPSLLGSGYEHTALAVLLQSFLARTGMTLVTGGYGVDAGSRRITNSLFVVDPGHGVLQPHYSKTHLLAFGEYIPGEEWFPGIRDWLPPIGEYARGPGPEVLLQWGRFRAGPQICYESLFPAFSRGLANLGAQFIINVTNDSWYGTWQEPYQHMYMTLARAVEFRRPVLRATNTGFSTVALASGEILQRSPLHRAWTGVFSVPFEQRPAMTFYQRFYWLMPAVLWVGLIAIILRPAARIRG